MLICREFNSSSQFMTAIVALDLETQSLILNQPHDFIVDSFFAGLAEKDRHVVGCVANFSAYSASWLTVLRLCLECQSSCAVRLINVLWYLVISWSCHRNILSFLGFRKYKLER